MISSESDNSSSKDNGHQDIANQSFELKEYTQDKESSTSGYYLLIKLNKFNKIKP